MMTMPSIQPKFLGPKPSFQGETLGEMIENRLMETVPLFQQPVASPQLMTEWLQRLAIQSAIHDMGYPYEQTGAMRALANSNRDLPETFRERLLDIAA